MVPEKSFSSSQNVSWNIFIGCCICIKILGDPFDRNEETADDIGRLSKNELISVCESKLLLSMKPTIKQICVFFCNIWS